MSDNITPEEKLLRLIRGEKKVKPKPSTPLQIKEEKDLVSSKVEIKRSFSWLARINKASLKKAIFAALIISCTYLFINLLYPFLAPKKLNISKIGREQAKETEADQIYGSKPLDYYLSVGKNRQLFVSAGVGESAEQPASIAGPDLMKNLTLVGIAAGDNPQAIIEDKKLLKTYYVSKGQMIDQFKVENILEGKIILSHGGQVYELSL